MSNPFKTRMTLIGCLVAGFAVGFGATHVIADRIVDDGAIPSAAADVMRHDSKSLASRHK